MAPLSARDASLGMLGDDSSKCLLAAEPTGFGGASRSHAAVSRMHRRPVTITTRFMVEPSSRSAFFKTLAQCLRRLVLGSGNFRCESLIVKERAPGVLKVVRRRLNRCMDQDTIAFTQHDGSFIACLTLGHRNNLDGSSVIFQREALAALRLIDEIPTIVRRHLLRDALERDGPTMVGRWIKQDRRDGRDLLRIGYQTTDERKGNDKDSRGKRRSPHCACHQKHEPYHCP
jgi:hypothetical protein